MSKAQEPYPQLLNPGPPEPGRHSDLEEEQNGETSDLEEEQYGGEVEQEGGRGTATLDWNDPENPNRERRESPQSDPWGRPLRRRGRSRGERRERGGEERGGGGGTSVVGMSVEGMSEGERSGAGSELSADEVAVWR